MARTTRSYPDTTVARIKAAHSLGFTISALARETGISHLTIRDWTCGRRYADVQPCEDTLRAIRRAILGGGGASMSPLQSILCAPRVAASAEA